MIDELLDRIVLDKLRKMSLTDRLTGFLVKKKKRGTYQAMVESQELEKKMTSDVVQFVKEWLINETIDGFIKKELDKEIKSQIDLELSRNGYNNIIK